MQQSHSSRKKYKKTKILIFFTTLILLGIAGFIYLGGPSKFSAESPATSTPIIKPSTKPVVVVPKPSHEPSISIRPSFVQQGEPAIITIEGLTSTTNVKSLTLDGRPFVTFMYEGYVTAFLGVDLYATPGTFPIVLTFKDGTQLKSELVINKREGVRRLFDIPLKLGGNTSESIKTLITTLAVEGKLINAVSTSKEILWTEKFQFPFQGPFVVDDPFGYTRIISNFTMPHKGADIDAPIGTPVYAMNTGIIVLAASLRNSGDTIIVDHGMGVQTVYMHLSEFKVINGQRVEKGEIIGLSGDTGYAGNPHLHLTARIWDVSIDPIKFLELFGE